MKIKKIKNKQLYLSVRGFSTAVLIVNTVNNEQTNIVWESSHVSNMNI